MLVLPVPLSEALNMTRSQIDTRMIDNIQITCHRSQNLISASCVALKFLDRCAIKH